MLTPSFALSHSGPELKEESDREQEERIRKLFGEIAEGYDQANDRISFGLHRLWKARLCRDALRELPSGESVLDLCCGTGDVACRLARFRPDAEVTGLDLTEKMLEIAGRRGAKTPGLHFVQGDAMDTAFPENRFRVVTAAFGLRNTADPERALREILRILKPGGSVFILESSIPENGLVRLGFRVYFSALMPVLGGGVRHRDAYRWLNESTWAFPRKEELSAKLREVGFSGVRYRRLLFGCAAIHTGKKP